MSFKVSFKSTALIKKRLNIEQGGKVQSFFTNNCARRMDKYVPMDTGMLKTNIFVNSYSVTYTQPYAKIQFYNNKGKGIKGKRWHKLMLSAEKDDLVKEVNDYIRRGAK